MFDDVFTNTKDSDCQGDIKEDNKLLLNDLDPSNGCLIDILLDISVDDQKKARPHVARHGSQRVLSQERQRHRLQTQADNYGRRRGRGYNSCWSPHYHHHHHHYYHHYHHHHTLPSLPVMAGWRRLRGRTGEVYDKPKAFARGGAEQSVLCSQMLFSDSASYLHQQPHATSYITVELHSHHQSHAGT
ncbi:hypothetical protein C0Q70_11895 [Pomacea canaliculata]|uniref:Uncharacterized protein n=1 Tax=Pomacea canaliculata TaxID=400727 RepID=A0A2T7P795_POMCA|nr:hypothetical protein C0Q70_11895 [Pomacea canaliculata]